MHIVLFSRVWPVTHFPSGIGSYVDALRGALLERGHRVTVLADQMAGGEDAATFQVGKDSWSYRARAALLGRFATRHAEPFAWWRLINARLQQIHRIHPIDLFEMEESFGWGGFIQQHTSIPVVVKLHGPAFLTTTEPERHTALAQGRIEIEGEELKHVAAIMSPSQGTLDDTFRYYGLSLPIARHVRNPVLIRPDTPRWQPQSCDKNSLLFVGRFDNIKGADLLLRAFKRLLAKRPEMTLTFVGPDSGLIQDGKTIHIRDFLQQEFGTSDPPSVRYLGPRSRLEIEALRVRAGAVLVTSRWESQCYAALEAMVQGCPVVAFDTGCLGEILQHEVTGRLAQADDLDGFGAQICHVLDRPEEALEMGARARQFVIDHHAPARVAEKTEEVYRDVLARRSR